MVKLLISPAANEDLIAIREYITKDLDSPKAAANTLIKIIKSIKLLVDFPLSGASLESIIEFPNSYRFVVSGKYISFYRYIDDTFFVDRVLYGSRDFVKFYLGFCPSSQQKKINIVKTGIAFG